MSHTQRILKEQREHNGIIRPVMGGQEFELLYRPRSKTDPYPFMRDHHHEDGRFRYSGNQVYVDMGYTIP